MEIVRSGIQYFAIRVARNNESAFDELKGHKHFISQENLKQFVHLKFSFQDFVDLGKGG